MSEELNNIIILSKEIVEIEKEFENKSANERQKKIKKTINEYLNTEREN